MNLGQYATANSLTTSRYLDTTGGFPGTEATGIYDPAAATVRERYGIPDSVEHWQYPEDQHVGPHLRDRDHIAAATLYAEALGVDPDPQWDVMDLDMVVGLTAAVIREMKAKGLKTADEQASDQPTTTPAIEHGQPAVTDGQTGDHPSPLTPRSTVQEAADHAKGVLAAHGFTERGGGDIARALRGLLAALGV